MNFVLRRTLALIVLALIPALFSHSQTKASPATSFPKVVASVTKAVSKAGEPVEVTATLENVGTESLYVPKELEGSSGFELELLSSGAPYCHVNADFACSSAAQKALKKRAAEQLLDEYFLLLPPGGLVGIHTRLTTTCPFPNAHALAPGKYEVTVVYSGRGVCIPELSKKDTRFPVFQSTVQGAPVQVELTQ